MMFEPTCRPETPYNPADRLYPIVRCMSCYAEVTGKNEDYFGKTAIAAWNRRPAQTYTQDQLDAAVRAERERCARIADGEAERHRLNYRAGRLVLDLYYETSALNVAAAIREGE